MTNWVSDKQQEILFQNEWIYFNHRVSVFQRAIWLIILDVVFFWITFIIKTSRLERRSAIRYCWSCGIFFLHTTHAIPWNTIGGCHRAPWVILYVKLDGFYQSYPEQPKTTMQSNGAMFTMRTFRFQISAMRSYDKRLWYLTERHESYVKKCHIF